MAAVIRSSSMKLVIATTSTAGWRRLSSAVAAMPSSPGISRSITTTSGEQRRRGVQRRLAVGRLADDLEIVVQVEEVAHPAPDHGVVVDDQDPDPVGHGLDAAGRRGRPGHRPSSASMAGAATARPPGAPSAGGSAAAARIARPPRTWIGARRLVEQDGRQRDARRPARTASGSRPASRRRAGCRSGTGSTGWPPRTAR